MVRQIERLRRRFKLGPVRIANRLGLASSTVYRVLCRLGLHRLIWLDRPTGGLIRRYEHERPGDLIHMDINKLGRIRPGGGWRNAGVIAFLFGRGADGATCACDANNDGTTNPTSINENTRTSLNADDDGGYFKERAAAYYQAGAWSHAGGAAPAPTNVPPTATPTRTPTPLPATATPTRTQTSVSSPATPTSTSALPTPTSTAAPSTQAWSTSAVTAPSTVKRGSRVGITTSVRPNFAATALVDVEVYARMDRRSSRLTGTVARSRPINLGRSARPGGVPSNAPTGTYTVRIGIFGVGWNGLLHWNHSATTFTVNR